MVAEGGGFAAALDADAKATKASSTSGRAEIDDVLGAERAASSRGVYDVTPEGNWEGHTILNRLAAPQLRSTPTKQRLAGLRAKLLAGASEARPPGLGRQGARRLERADDRRPGPCRRRVRSFTLGDDGASSLHFVEETMTVASRLVHSWCVTGSAVHLRRRAITPT